MPRVHHRAAGLWSWGPNNLDNEAADQDIAEELTSGNRGDDPQDHKPDPAAA